MRTVALLLSVLLWSQVATAQRSTCIGPHCPQDVQAPPQREPFTPNGRRLTAPCLRRVRAVHQGKTISGGSSCLIGGVPGGGDLVLTACHLTSLECHYEVESAGVWHRCEVLYANPSTDVLLLAGPESLGERCHPVSPTPPQERETVQLISFYNGRPWLQSGWIAKRVALPGGGTESMSSGDYYCNITFVNGQSGGVALNAQGQVVGLITSSDGEHGCLTCWEQIRDALAAIENPPPRETPPETPPEQTNAEPPPGDGTTPPPRSQPENPRDLRLERINMELRVLMRKVDRLVLKPGPPGPRGPAGPAGPEGPVGQAAEDLDTRPIWEAIEELKDRPTVDASRLDRIESDLLALDSRIEQLAVDLAVCQPIDMSPIWEAIKENKPQPRRVLLVDKKTGDVLDDEVYAPGEPIVLDVRRLQKVRQPVLKPRLPDEY